MDLSMERVITLESLQNKTWCKHIVESYNSSAHYGGGDTTTNMKMVFTVVLMAILGAILFVLGLYRLFLGRQARFMVLGRYDLCAYVPILMHSTFVLFLPLLSSVFSQTEARNAQQRILLALLWMLLVELIRKKVQVMVLPTDGSSFKRGTGRFSLTDYSDEVARLVWVGYLIYTNIVYAATSPALAAMFVLLWSLSLVKLVQRAVNTWMASRSWHTAKNPLLIAGYMQHLVDEEKEDSPAAGIDNCNYVVTGEHMLVPAGKNTTPVQPKVVTTVHYGYGVGKHAVPDAYCDQNEQKHFNLLIDLEVLDPKKNNKLVTVKKAWAQAGEVFSDDRRKHYLQNLCLSFSLFKMLRRRFEHYPMAELGSKMPRELMLDAQLTHKRIFQVLQLELDFLDHYYLASVPVVMSEPSLFFCNFACSMLFVFVYFLAVSWMLVANKDVAYLYCTAMGWGSSLKKFPFLDLAITISLLVTIVAIEATEFCNLYLFSHWNIVRLLCLHHRCGRLGKRLIRWFLAVRCWLSQVLLDLIRYIRRESNNMEIKQVSILDNCWPIDKYHVIVPEVPLATEATVDIIDSLKRVISVSLGTDLLMSRYWEQWKEMQSKMKSLVGRGKTATEVILAFHLATELFEIKNHGEGKNKSLEDSDRLAHDKRTVAITLSRYCMYLVAHMPALLPDDEAWVSDRYDETRSCLGQASSICCGIMCTSRHHCRKTMAEMLEEKKDEELKDPSTRVAMKLFRELKSRPVVAHVWTELAGLWVKLLVYVAPSNDVQGHAKALASSGGDLITCLWAFCTHAGITRERLEPGEDVP